MPFVAQLRFRRIALFFTVRLYTDVGVPAHKVRYASKYLRLLFKEH